MMANGVLGFGYGGGFLMPFIMIALWALLMIVVVYIFRLMTSSSGLASSRAGVVSPVNVLKLRYAKGDLTKEEYERMKMGIS